MKKMILLADNDISRSKGLMGHRPLKEDECAFFYFQKESCPSFWNKNVDFPISLIFLNKEGVVEDIKYLEAHQLDFVKPSSKKIRHVIEAHKQAPNIYKINIGNRIDFKDIGFFVEEKND